MRSLFSSLRRFPQTIILEVVAVVLMTMFIVIAPHVFAADGIYAPINYQGKLSSTGGTALANGTYNMRFRVFSATSGGVPLWTETWDNTNQRITSTGGLFSIPLGAHTAMTGSVNFNSDSLYLQVEFDPGNDGTYEEIFSPRRRFASVPYAHNSNFLDGISSSQFLRSDANTTASGTLTMSPRDASKIGIDILSTAGAASTAALRLSSQGANHILFGTGAGSYDTNLYRSGVSTLKTDSSFRVLGTLSGQNLIVSGVSSFSGSSVFKRNLTSKGTLSGMTLIVSGVSSFSGSSTFKNNLIVRGTLSGQTLQIANNAAISGALIIKGNLATKANLSGSALFGMGLGDCNNTTASKLIYNNSTGKFSCGTDQNSGTNTPWFGSGNVLSIGDNRYVKKQGDTMTGALTINLSSGYLGLKILQMASGSMIHAEKSLTSSGLLMVTQSTIRGSGALVVQQLRNSTGAYLVSSGAHINAPLLALDSSTGSARAPHILFGYRGSFDVALYRTTGAVLNLSGHLLPGLTNKFDLGSSTKRWRSLYLSGGTMYIGTAGNQSSINYNTSASRFGIDSNADGTNELSILSTGNVGVGTAIPKAKLDVSGTISGTTLTISKNGSFSGSLIVKNNFSGSALFGMGLGDCSNTTTSKLIYNNSTGKFSCASDQTGGGGSAAPSINSGSVFTLGNRHFVNIGGDQMTGALVINFANSAVGLDIKQAAWVNSLRSSGSILSKGTISGSNLIVSSNANISGALLVKGNLATKANLSGSALFGMGLGDCNNSTISKLIYNNSTGKFSCATDQTGGGGSGLPFTNAEGIYVNQAGDTMTGALTINITGGNINTIGLKIISTLSGANIHAENMLTSSGGLILKKRSGTSTGNILVVDTQGLVYDATNKRVGINTSSPNEELTVVGRNTHGTIQITNETVGTGTSDGAFLESSTDGTFALGNYENDSMTFYTNNTLRMTILAEGAVGIGTSSPKAKLDVAGTISGTTLTMSKNGSFSGSLIVKNNLSGSSLFGFGLGDCSNSTTSKLIYNNSTGKFSCASDQTAGGGSTYTAGQGLTTNGTNFRLSDTFSGTTVRILNSLSGAILHAEKTLTSSGTLTVEGAMSGATLYVATSINGAGLTDCDVSTNKLLWDSTTGRFSCSTDLNTGSAPPSINSGSVFTLGNRHFVNVGGDQMTGALVINFANSAVGLDIKQAAWVNSLRSSGSILSKGTISGSNLIVSGVSSFSGVVVLKGNLLSKGTLSGQNLIISGVSSFSGSSTFKNNLIVKGTLSGQTLQIAQNASVSGALLVKGNLATKANLSGSALFGMGLGDCNNSTTSKLIYNNTTGKFSCASDQTGSSAPSINSGSVFTLGNRHFVNVGGDTMTGALTINITGGGFAAVGLRVVNTITGAVIHAEKDLTSSGNIVAKLDITAKRNLSGSSITVSRNGSISGSLTVKTSITSLGSLSGSTFYGANLGDCNNSTTSKLIYNLATGKFGCATDQTGSSAPSINSGSVFTLGNRHFVNIGGDTMTGSLLVQATLSGRLLIVSNNASISGALLVKGNIGTKGTLSGQNLIVSGVSSFSGSSTFKNNLIVKGTLSGQTLQIAQNAAISGALIIKGNLATKATLSGASVFGFGLGDCSNSTTSKLIYNNSTGKFSCASDQTGGGSSYTAGQGLTTNGTNFRLSDTFSGTTVKILSSLSGSVLHAEKTLTSSGTLTIEGAMSGATLYVATSLNGAGLTDCDIAGTSKLLWDSTTGRFSCGSDQTGGGGSAPPSINSGSVFTLGNLHFVNIGGDTMTGSLLVQATLSGRLLIVSNNASISGALLTKGNISTRGTFSGAALNIMSGNSYFLGKLGIGKSGTPNTQLEIVGMGSGTSLFAMRALTSSGFFAVQQSIAMGSGAIIMEQKANNTGAYLMSSFTGSTHPLLALDSARRSFKAPAIMFGYRGSFDTSLQRTNTGTLALSGSLVIENTLGIKVFGVASALTVCRSLTGMLSVCSSSLRYKEDIADLGIGLSTLRQMRPVDFKWKGRDERDIGFIAEEVAAIDPMLATYNSAGQIEGVKYMQLTAVLTKAVQTLDTRLLGITNDSGTVLHARDLLRSSGALKVATFGTFGSGILIDTTYTNGSTDVFTVKSNVGGSGKTVFRINASGSVFTTGTFNSQGADYAEWFKSADRLKTGEAVCIDITRDNSVLRCARDADPNVMGIVSTRPAFIGNTIPGTEGLSTEAMARRGYFLIGLIGQVPAKATLEGGAIRSGDALTSASVSGFVRRARAGDSTVGVALEAYDGSSSRSTINVLISRRNSSMTVDAVGQKVLDTIASMQIGDEVKRMVASSAQQFSLSGSLASAITSEIKSLDLDPRISAAIGKHLSGTSLPLTIVSNATAGLSIASGGTLHAAALEVESGATISGALHLNGPMMVANQFSIFNSYTSALSVSGSAIEIGSLMSSGSLKLIGPVTIVGLSTFLGNVEVRGEFSLSGRQAGVAVIPIGGTGVTVSFSGSFLYTPIVTATSDDFGSWRLRNRTQSGFVIELKDPAEEDTTFTWLAISSRDPMMTNGEVRTVEMTPFPVNVLGQPVSSDPVWNGCIQGHPMVDGDGIPFSCSRYHSDTTWDHPDLHISFIYNSNHSPAILTIPEGYQISVIQGEAALVGPMQLEDIETETLVKDEAEPSPESSEVMESDSVTDAVVEEVPEDQVVEEDPVGSDPSEEVAADSETSSSVTEE